MRARRPASARRPWIHIHPASAFPSILSGAPSFVAFPPPASAIIHSAPTPTGELRMRAISLDEAMKLINGTFAAAAERKLRPLTAVVLDAGGRVKAALK